MPLASADVALAKGKRLNKPQVTDFPLMDDTPQNLTLTEVIWKLHQDRPGVFAIIYGAIVVLILGVLVGLWMLWGAGPRRWRGLRAAQALLAEGNWQGALEQLTQVRAIGMSSESWIKTFDEFEAECLQAGMNAALADKKFEDALKHGQQAAKLLDQPEHEVRIAVQNAMLREIRRLFSKPGETDATLDLITRTLKVQSPCREASFWLAMCEIRLGALEPVLIHLQVARTGQPGGVGLEDGEKEHADSPTPAAPPSPFLDPPLYLGAVLLRMGRAKEALRFLTEANRMDPNCPFIRLQLGAAIVTAGGDTNMAVRALQFALGPKGLGQYLDKPAQAWINSFPEHHSYIRKLASEFPFTCPLFGEDMKYLFYQGNLALAQGQFKLGNFKEAAELFDKVMKEGAPSLPVLRGLGLSLAKLSRYDDAFVHLKTAHEMESDKDRITAGYLALCGASGKPSRPEAKLQNIAWAIRLVTQFNAPRDAEWADLLGRIFAAARTDQIPFTNDDQLYLCEHLTSVKATDKLAAQAFHHLLATAPELMHPEYAWLFCQADQLHDVGGDRALALYIRTFADRDAARAYYEAQGWSLDDVERMFLRRAAERVPGRFPDVLGADYTPRGEQLLLAKAQEQEDAGQRDAALQTIEILVKLSPNNTSATDRAAGLHYRAGRLRPAYDLLEQWHRAAPMEPLPLVRQAILLHEGGADAPCFAKLHAAMALASGRRRANIAFLGSRLALRRFLVPPARNADSPAASGATEIASDMEALPGADTPAGVIDMLATVHAFLLDCLAHDPSQPHGLWCLAAVRCLQGDIPALSAQAKDMQNADVADRRYHLLAALCHLVGGDYPAVIGICERAANQVATESAVSRKHLAIEAGYLAGLAHIALRQPALAIDPLKKITYNTSSPTLSFAQALLGNVLFAGGRHDEAINAWQSLDAGKRHEWKLVEPLAQTTFISALDALLAGDYEQAAEKFRQAGRLGYRDRRLGPLLLLALFKAGQKSIYVGETAPVRATVLAKIDN